ncbi:GntR family transcriptional regulator [Miniphocaeibacter massiliensis]|uniref:GntR family transcriptional regulator n=1 Tax=Miniphocaeibacter massiliensis TaxID=2041841 RepID=UPI000C1C41C1|nr:GntR family transcriptional regulator [Miniphocaeibacter massiliensis]
MPLPNTDKVVPKKSTKDIVYSELLKLIINGTLKQGEKLVESELTEYFGVSRTPIREALQSLKDVKLVSIVPGQYTIVEYIDIDDMDNCYLVLTNLQVLALEQAYNKFNKENIKYLKEITKAFEKSIENYVIEDIVDLDNQFHSFIVGLTNNSYLIDIISMLQLHVTRLKYYYFKEDQMRTSSAKEHWNIIEAIESKNIEASKQEMYNHWQRVRKTSLEMAKTILNKNNHL